MQHWKKLIENVAKLCGRHIPFPHASLAEKILKTATTTPDSHAVKIQLPLTSTNSFIFGIPPGHECSFAKLSLAQHHHLEICPKWRSIATLLFVQNGRDTTIL